MIRNETYLNGVCVSAEIIDLVDGTITTEERGVAISVRPLTAEEVEVFTQPDPAVAVEARISSLEAENAALRKALVKGAVITDAAIEAEKVITAEDTVKVVK